MAAVNLLPLAAVAGCVDGGAPGEPAGDDAGAQGRDAEIDAAADAADAPDARAEGDAEDVFDVGAIHEIRIDMDAADWEALRNGREWWAGELRWDGESAGEVGLRAFGMGSYNPDKPNIKIAFDHFERGRKWRGLEQLKLDNSTQDPSYLRERLGTAIFRRFGVPAARTGWASLVVNGDRLGLYVVLEAIDDRFLDRWFGNDDGILYDTVQGAWGHGLMPLDDPLAYYNPQMGEADGSDLVELTRLIASGSDEDLARALDLEGFLKESVARSVMGSIDSFSSDGNNYYLYDDTGFWRIIPWDLDFDMTYPVDPWEPWAYSPWAADSLTGEPYQDPVLIRQIELGADIDGTIAELVQTAMSCSVVDAELVSSVELIRDEAVGDPLGAGAVFDENVEALRQFLRDQIVAFGGSDCAAD
ncbi:MAG: CotH kinase family protein [Deltaproteobacteria bacterium]|nr:CotH kinase family protein [Deltaproteobacteria bacterium]